MLGMSETTATQPQPNTPRRTRGSLIVLGVLVVVWVIWAVVWLVSPDQNPGGQCAGIGWGCTLTPRQGMTFLAVLGLIPLTGLVLLITGAVRLLRIGNGSPRTWADVVVWLLLGAGVALFLLATFQGAI